MNLDVVLFIVNGFLGVVMYFIKGQHDRTKEDIRELKVKYDALKDTSVHKLDLKEFKEDLYRRLDKVEDNLKQQLAERLK